MPAPCWIAPVAAGPPRGWLVLRVGAGDLIIASASRVDRSEWAESPGPSA
jgi:hypothetical protein